MWCVTDAPSSSMHVTLEPPLEQWRSLRRGEAEVRADRAPLLAMINGGAERLGAGRLSSARSLIATGHQAALWHPGILAKDLAAAVAAEWLQAAAFHLVVDQDIHESMQLDLPVNDAGRLSTRKLQLGPINPALPTGMQPPIDAAAAIHAIDAARAELGDRLAVDLEPLRAAWADLPPCRNLAQQAAVLTECLMRPYTGPMPLLFASDLLSLSPIDCVAFSEGVGHYNAAVSLHPQAGIAPLAIETDRVELPLWALRWNRPRRRVYTRTKGGTTQLVDDANQTLDDQVHLAPRALLQTALLRDACCDLFVHGRGGWGYDRVTEIWWRRWQGRELAPMVLATADLRLPFEAPHAEPQELTRAAWYAHHLPFNLDRVLRLDERDDRVRRKRELLAHMDNDRDRVRRAAAFAEIHRINDELSRRYRDAIVEAGRRLRETRLGAANRAIAGRRDWFFALYPAAHLQNLRRTIASAISA